MLLSLNYRAQRITISPDHAYRIANRELTEQEIQDRCRDALRFKAERPARRRRQTKPA
ncbi:hypothetical protein C7S16_5726 [Burkholderia thailandensis]|uniref:Uncharacterized protein n=1 Tax=Burkholderia thailandensis TaxID=57975 RepID=A0AAW9CSV3_BURTH|nr:hypothetical protein [Burkholderia thailandensis]MDW9253694.1 hypothetical protein [Burkholderia thailandensis]